VLGGPRARGREQQEQMVLAATVEQCRGLFLASGESELVAISGPGPRQVAGRDRRKHMPAVQHAALLCSSGHDAIITPARSRCLAGLQPQPTLSMKQRQMTAEQCGSTPTWRTQRLTVTLSGADMTHRGCRRTGADESAITRLTARCLAARHIHEAGRCEPIVNRQSRGVTVTSG
jgi:hypothetical protein